MLKNNEVNTHSAWRSLPLSLDAFDVVWDAISALAGETPQTRAAMMACDEWIANVVAYSGATRFSFQCARDGDDLCSAFSDDGVHSIRRWSEGNRSRILRTRTWVGWGLASSGRRHPTCAIDAKTA